MSALGEETQVDEAPQPGSLQDRIARRQRELEKSHENSIVIGVPGFEDIFAVQYRTLSYREMMKLEARHEKVKDDAERVLLVAADKLLNACERIVEPSGKDEYKDTGYKWGLKAARELFGCDLPDTATARQGLIASFQDEETLVRHAGDWQEQRDAIRNRVDSGVSGESGASSAAT